ncbi:hypothetical protein [Rhodococcus sp. 15-649-2-2]|uniref:hypothetical protein n=1 Tax=Rhodococcus sp. 15-649-2-2 TaxID=2023140 RepID=UPI00117AD40F|nr:hypothetical protein [Rhodococcus sp. 15-649-2-2]
MSALLQAATYQVADLVGPVTVLEGAGQHLLSRLTETDPHRWAVTAALGSIVAARKSLEQAAEALMDVRTHAGADMLAVEVDGGALVNGNEQCPSRYVVPGDTEHDQPTRCRLDAGHPVDGGLPGKLNIPCWHTDWAVDWSDSMAVGS